MRRIGLFTLTVLYDNPAGGGAGSGAPAGGGSGSGTPGAGSGAPSGTPDPTPPARVDSAAAPAAAVTPPAKKYEYPEDRGDWVPAHRMSETANKAARFESENRRLAAMLKAGTGYDVGQPGEPEDPEIVEARNLFLTKILPPEMRKALEFLIKNQDVLSQLSTRGNDLISTTDQSWERLGLQTVEGLYASFAKDMGITPDKLTAYQKSFVGTAFVTYLETNPAVMQRYVRGDAKVADDFLAEYRSGFIDPFRRSGQAPDIEIARRNRNLPGAPKQGAVVPDGAAPKQKLSEDEIHDRAFKQFDAIQRAGS